MTIPGENIVMYGTSWCGDCHRAKYVLDRLDVPYEWINIDESEDAEAEMLRLNGGRRRVPTISFPDGSYLVEPSSRELTERLQSVGPGRN